MTSDAPQNKSSISKNVGSLSEALTLKKLVQEVQHTLCIDDAYDANSVERFSGLNKGKYDPFGYDLKNGARHRSSTSHYKRNRLRHKLQRIQKEFRFASKHLENYKKLTSREKEIIQLLAAGKNNPEIAGELFICRCTVEQHRKNINRKLRIKSFAQLMRFSYAFDLV